MKFDEAWKEIQEQDIPVEIPDEAPDAEILESDLIDIFEELRETYAPTVELTREQKNVWDKAVDCASDNPNDFVYFVDNLDTENTHSEKYPFEAELIEFRNNSRKLMNMWLHPECMKVVD